MKRMSRTKKEKDQIISELQWIYENYHHFDEFLDVKPPVVIGAGIGKNVGHFKPNNYVELYNKTLEDEDYSIWFLDGSLICFYYIFDSSGKITGHNIMYVPSPIDETGVSSEDVAFAKYLRADFDQTGYESIVHTQVHLHVSIFKTDFRIPLAHYLSPKEFLYIILKYIHHSKGRFVDKLIDDKKHELLLNNEELNKLRLIFGE